MALFDPIAQSYDLWYQHPVGRKMDEQEKAAMEEHLPPSSVYNYVLEVGCGTGHWTQWLTQKGYNVLGIDVSGNMIAKAREKNILQAQFLRKDVLQCDRDERFDLALAITTLEFIPDYKAAVAQMAHFLKPGGRLVVGVLNKYSYLGLQRKLFGSKGDIFASAKFFDYWELEALLAEYGEPYITGSTFALPHSWLTPLADISEWIGTEFFQPFGNFLIGSVAVP